MASVKHDVPVVAQALSMSCWYAAACMVSFYYRAGPRQGLPKVYHSNEGISVPELDELARVEGLIMLRAMKTHEFSPASLMAVLSVFGPIWCAGDWFGSAHAIVVTGADDAGEGRVFFNDPDGGVKKEETIDWFNKKRLRGTMMVKDHRRS